MTSPTTGVTVGAFLRGRTEALGLGLKLLAGASGLDRLITSPYAQKTGLALALVRMPVAPGRRVATLVEVAARTQLLRARGHHAARNLAAKVGRQLGRPVRSPRSDLDGSIGANDDALESEPEGREP